MKTHKLKTWPVYFQMVKCGRKKFEVRKNDRRFEVGQFLLLEEFHIENGYTGDCLLMQIDYILFGGEFGIEEDTVIMSISPKQP